MTDILNERGWIGYGDQDRTHEGTSGGKVRSYANPLVAQISTLTVALAETGVFTVEILDNTGALISASYTAAVPPDDNAAVAAGLRDEINSSSAWANVATATAAAAVVTINFLHPGLVYTAALAQTAPGSATLTYAQTQSAGGTTLPIARWVVQREDGVDDQQGCQLPLVGSTAVQMLGIIVRPAVRAINTLSPLLDAPELLGPGMIPVHFEGVIYSITNHGSVTAGTQATPNVFVVINPAGGQGIGLSRADADGGNTVALPITQAKWLTVTAPGAQGDVFVRT